MEKSQSLHDEIFDDLRNKSVDPFERSLRPEEDSLFENAKASAPDLTKGRITLTYWRNFSKNRRYLEAKSEKAKNATDSSKSLSRCGKIRSKNKTIVQQDVRQPNSLISYSFAPQPSGCAKFDGHIIGHINRVDTLMRDKGERNFMPPKSESGDKSYSCPSYHPGDIGCSVRGGTMSQGSAREKLKEALTQNTAFPSVWELDGGNRHIPGGSLPTSLRFPPVSTSSGDRVIDTLTLDRTSNFKGRFSSSERFRLSTHDADAAPSAGSYNIPRLFDGSEKLSPEKARLLVQKFNSEGGIKRHTCPELVSDAVFGYGCSFEEHIRYGVCLDGRCVRRSMWEEVMLLSNDENRLRGVSKIISRSEAHRIREDADFSPLKTAALSGDIETIVKLCTIGGAHTINEVDRENRQSVLHHCVTRNFLHLVNYLTGGSNTWNEDNKLAISCRNLFNGVIDMNIHDSNGDTPLHLASRFGYHDITEALCDAGSSPTSLNNRGETPFDVAKTQRVFQIIKMNASLHAAREELADIVEKRSEVELRIKSRRSKTGLVSNPLNTASEDMKPEEDDIELDEQNSVACDESGAKQSKSHTPRKKPHSYIVGHLPEPAVRCKQGSTF